jgi:hypothetical protein
MEVLQKVVSTEAPAIERFAPHVPLAVSAVLKRGLEKDPAARYDTVLAFALALSAACQGSQPPSTEPVGSARTLPASGASPTARRVTPPNEYHPGERYQTGSQRRAASRFGNASTLSGSATLQDIPRALEQARQALGLGDLTLAVSYAESALRVAEGFDSPEAQRLIDTEEMLIDHIFETRLGSLEHRLSVKQVPSGPTARVSPEQAFLLSRLDGGVTVEEVLDLSPLPRRDTLRLLAEMLRDGLIATLG